MVKSQEKVKLIMPTSKKSTVHQLQLFRRSHQRVKQENWDYGGRYRRHCRAHQRWRAINGD
jgi:hypothetical protein